METETTALVKVEHPKSQGAIVLKEALRDAAEQRSLLVQYVEKHMVKGTDYGEIPGTKNPTLLKPGAEKLVDLFRCTPKFTLVSKEEDFERGFFNYMFRVRLFSRDADAVLAEGFGSANSREGRYRWRSANRKCPHCGKEAIIAGKAEYGGGWLCFKKKGGCGAKFDALAVEITSQPLGQVENDDIATLANTILKMAKKRALVDGAIALARCSDLFTQDVEDIQDPDARPEPPPPEPQRARAEPKAAAPAQPPPPAPAPPCDHEWGLKGKCLNCGAVEPKPATPPRQAIPQQSPAVRARASRVWKQMALNGRTIEDFQAWSAKVLGRNVPSVEWTEDDVGHLENALAEALAAPEPGSSG